ncbi:hypothetical protein DIZ27_14580 [Streptomyces sp. NWU339]|uniref:hypothetical protein n=1 Tax=Streptomyces sp. NWU339 TaxID=2185284 RepID=UPI000D677B35|nr:hypothetical protein [Streptomyces sp. NWU339]PWI09759.1 hypothetical protein DIZ27_14580 [Streptomyces sp. NWU339]
MATQPPAARRAMEAARVDEIRDLLARLVIPRRPDDPELPGLLADSRSAIAELLNDRDDLIRANGEAAEELARWNGAL